MIDALLGKDTVLLPSQAMTNGATVSQYQDCGEAQYQTVRCSVNMGATGTIASNSGVTVSLATSDLTNATTFSTIQSSSAVKVGTTGAEVLFHTDCRKQKRYLEVSVTAGTANGTNENCTVSAIGTLTGLAQTPSGTVANPGLGGTYVTGSSDQFFIN